MGEMGSGYPLFFEYLKYWAYLLLMLSVIYVLPAASILAGEYQDILEKNGGLQDDEDPIALFSIGAILNERIWHRAQEDDLSEFK